MYGNGYGLGLLVAVIVGLVWEFMKWRHNRSRINIKKQQIAARLQNKIADKRAVFDEKRGLNRGE